MHSGTPMGGRGEKAAHTDSGGTSPANAWMLDIPPLELGDDKCLLLKPHKVWSFAAGDGARRLAHPLTLKEKAGERLVSGAPAPPASGSARAPALPWARSIVLPTAPAPEAPLTF